MKVSKDVTVAGATIFVKVSGTRKKLMPGEKRKPKTQPTPEHVQELNQKYSERNLAMILNHNFSGGDCHCVLTHGGEEPDTETAKKRLDKFKRDIGALYKAENVPLRWVIVTEYKHQRIHHHLVCSGGVELSKIHKIWKHGFVKATLLDDSRDYRKLAAYLTKETSKTFRDANGISRRRYSCSRSIQRPETRREYVSPVHLFSSPKPIPGYYIDQDSIYKGANPFTEQPYIEYIMISLTPEPRVEKWRRGKRVRNSQAAYNAWLRKNGYEQLEFIF